MILHYLATEMQEIPPCRKSDQLFNWPDLWCWRILATQKLTRDSYHPRCKTVMLLKCSSLKPGANEPVCCDTLGCILRTMQSCEFFYQQVILEDFWRLLPLHPNSGFTFSKSQCLGEVSDHPPSCGLSGYVHMKPNMKILTPVHLHPSKHALDSTMKILAMCILKHLRHCRDRGKTNIPEPAGENRPI